MQGMPEQHDRVGYVKETKVNGNRIPREFRGISDIPTPCHIIDLDRLDRNLDKVKNLKELSGCKVLLAVKGFSLPALIEKMKGCIDGISASGLYEAKMGRDYSLGYVQTYSPGFQKNTIRQVAEASDAVVFNSLAQMEKFIPAVKEKHCACGIRVNPMFSDVKKADADPCMEYSRLGIPCGDLTAEILRKAEGIHIHAMCEQHADALEKLCDFVIEKLGGLIDEAGCIRWINLGGGQLIGRDDYDISRAAAALKKIQNRFNVQVYIEPCEGIVTECGWLAVTVCDIVENGKLTAILDSSPVCHLPDAVFRGWRHDIYGELPEGKKGYDYFLSGPTCFAGDTLGEYTFGDRLQVGDILFLEDTAAYSWVKNSAFNGIPFPSICSFRKKEGLKLIKSYAYDLFLKNL